MMKEKKFWIGLSLFNLALVAFFGLLMRSKMLFSIPFVDYRHIISAHSHLAFSGWVGLAILTMLIYDVLPAGMEKKKIYGVVLWSIEISSVGMAVSFPFGGYYVLSIIFSTLYIVTTYVFGWVFIRDMKRSGIHPVVNWLSTGGIASLILSSIGPFGLSYILITKSTNSLLYRDAIYTFLHLQYNGFFTLCIFALFFATLIKKGIQLPAAAKPFSVFLLLSVLPSLFVALLWHNLEVFYIIGAIGCLFALISVVFFIPLFRKVLALRFFQHPLARVLWIAAFGSFVIKMVLAVGTIYPPLGNAVYGARPIIIGFLHLVFLAFVSFYLLSQFIEAGFYDRGNKLIKLPFYVFGLGVLANEIFLMVQGVEILFKTNSSMYNWLLWVAAIVLFSGACLLTATFYSAQAWNKKAAAIATADEFNI